MKLYLLAFVLISMTAFAQKKNKGAGNTRTKSVRLIDNTTYLLTETTSDTTYAFTQSNPVKVGGVTKDGVLNERRFLNALLTKDGKPLKYFRAGSCCPFKTPNGLIDDSGLLDRYRIYEEGKTDTLDIYINLYDEGDLLIPAGLTAKK